MEELEIGHVVQLRSGGPKMTVHSLDSDDDVLCQWFEGREMHEENFLKEVVKKVVEDGGSRTEDGVLVIN
jgi:uncharacterized protein YodC (DUF2158 family)